MSVITEELSLRQNKLGKECYARKTVTVPANGTIYSTAISGYTKDIVMKSRTLNIISEVKDVDVKVTLFEETVMVKEYENIFAYESETFPYSKANLNEIIDEGKTYTYVVDNQYDGGETTMIVVSDSEMEFEWAYDGPSLWKLKATAEAYAEIVKFRVNEDGTLNRTTAIASSTGLLTFYEIENIPTSEQENVVIFETEPQGEGLPGGIVSYVSNRQMKDDIIPEFSIRLPVDLAEFESLGNDIGKTSRVVGENKSMVIAGLKDPYILGKRVRYALKIENLANADVELCSCWSWFELDSLD